MRDYAKVSPKFWTGDTGQRIVARGSEALIVALYLMTSPHSNMLGLYRLPTLYLAEETGLSPEGASKGLTECMEEGFCDYDPQSKMVWVFEMASYQIASELKSGDLRVKGINKEYNGLPNMPFLGSFFDRYADKFHLADRREFIPKDTGVVLSLVSPSKAPSKPGAGEGTGAGARTGIKPSASSPAKLPTCQTAEVIALYHEILPDLPKVRLHTKGRVRAIAKVWAWVLTSTKSDHVTRRAQTPEQALAWFREYFERARSNDFLMGKTPRTGDHANWQCDLDFLLTDKGMKHVIEKTNVRDEGDAA